LAGRRNEGHIDAGAGNPVKPKFPDKNNRAIQADKMYPKMSFLGQLYARLARGCCKDARASEKTFYFMIGFIFLINILHFSCQLDCMGL
jgi:hypothetical protein